VRVLVLINSLYTGGAEYSTLLLYGWLKRKGYAVKLVCCKKASPAYDPALFGFEHAHYLAGNSFYAKRKELKAIIREFKPDIVHSVLFDANIMARSIRIFGHTFTHVESLVNETYSQHRLLEPGVTAFKLNVYKLLDYVTQRFGVDHFHANSQTVADHYHKHLFISSARITVIPRGRECNPKVGDSDNRKRVREKLGTGERWLIMNVARHEYQKAQDVLLDAVIKLKSAGSAFQLVLVGREGKLTPFLRQEIEKHGLENDVLLLGHRSDVGDLLAATDIFVFPSRFEGLPGALIEAEASGLPLVVSDIGPNREVGVEGRNALFVPVVNSSALYSKLAELMDNQQERERMGRESLALFNEKYVLEEVHKLMLAWLKETLNIK
jgi:glycosyltransferase involved in cell wall biosynthesis